MLYDVHCIWHEKIANSSRYGEKKQTMYLKSKMKRGHYGRAIGTISKLRARKKTISANMVADVSDVLEFGKLAQDEVLQILPLMIDLVCNHEDKDVKDRALFALSQTLMEHDVAEQIDWEPLASCLSTLSDEQKGFVFVFLGFSKKRQYLPLLETYLSHPDKDLSDAAKDAIADIHYKRA